MLNAFQRSLLIALSAMAAPAFAAGGWDNSPLGRARFGEPWSGAAVSRPGLVGKVVLVKSWADW